MLNLRALKRLLFSTLVALPLIFGAAPAQADYLVCVNVLTVYVLGTPHPLPYAPICKVWNDDFTVMVDSVDCTPEPMGLIKVCRDIVVHRPPVDP